MKRKKRSIQEERREGLAAHLDTVRVLLRQGLPLRGYTDEESNIYQFNKDKSCHVPGLRRLMNENKYMPHEVLEEQEKDLVLSARNELINEIRNAKFFSIIYDESTDMSKTEQLTFSVRYCSYEYEVKDAFIGIIPCDNGLTSEALLGYIKDIMIRCSFDSQKLVAGSFDSQKLVAVAFDGASIMKHLAQLIKKEIAPDILYIHCVAHYNELVVKDASNNSALLEGAQSLCEFLYVLVGISPKRVLIFENLQKEMDSNGCVQRLKNLSRTRWTTRANAINVILTKHEELKAALQAIKSDDNTKNDCKEKCNHFIKKLDNFQQMFYMVSTFELIAILEHNSKIFQTMSLTPGELVDTLDKTKIKLKELRCNEEFQRLLNKVYDLGLSESTPEKRRCRKPSSTLKDFFIYDKGVSDETATQDICSGLRQEGH